MNARRGVVIGVGVLSLSLVAAGVVLLPGSREKPVEVGGLDGAAETAAVKNAGPLAGRRVTAADARPEAASPRTGATSVDPKTARFLAATAAQRAQEEGSFKEWAADGGTFKDVACERRLADGGQHSFCGSTCSSVADCGAGEACGLDARSGDLALRCLRSNCAADADCGPEERCELSSNPNAGPPLYRCAPPGPAREGEACVLFGDKAPRCGKGLTCINDECMRTCSAGCRQGERCIDVPAPKELKLPQVCWASCSADADCAKGQTCLKFGELTACKEKLGAPTCTREGNTCEAGSDCIVEVGRQQAHFECATCCNPLDANSCGTGAVCGRGSGIRCSSFCYRTCKSTADCPADHECSTVDEEMKVLGCKPAAR